MAEESSDDLPKDQTNISPSDISGDESRKKCSSCCEEIPGSAIVCRQCHSYQGVWWWVRLTALSVPWLGVFASIGAYFLHEYRDSQKTLYDVAVRLQSFDGDKITLDVVNGYSKPIFLQAPRLFCSAPNDYADEYDVGAGRVAAMIPESAAPGQLAPGDFRRIQYKLGSGLDRKLVAKEVNVTCEIMFNYTDATLGLTVGRGALPIFRGELLKTFLNGGTWPP